MSGQRRLDHSTGSAEVNGHLATDEHESLTVMKGAHNKMSENDQGPSHGGEQTGQKEMRQLLWIGIISIWLTMVLILYMGTTSYQNSRDVQRLSEAQDTSAIVKEMALLRAEAGKSSDRLSGEQKAAIREIRAQVSSSVQRLLAKQQTALREMSAKMAKTHASVEKRLGEQQAAMAQINTQLAANSGKVDQTVEKLLGDQKAVNEAIRSMLSANAESMEKTVEKLIGDQKEGLSQEIKVALSATSESVQKLLADQKGVIEGIKDDALNSEGITLFKKFLESQKSLLGELSGALGKDQ